MFVLGSAEYVPAKVVDNDYFARLTGRSAEWFVQRTGIQERRRAGNEENIETMGIAAVDSLLAHDANLLAGVDLIIGATYTPKDTIGTLAHVIQRRFALRDAKALCLSTACSSFLDAIDVADTYLSAGRARRVLVVAAEHNSAFCRDEDETSGHLWGDGAAAFLFAADATQAHFEVVDVRTKGLADQGRGPEAISLEPRDSGLVMRHGREVFARACEEMAIATRDILDANRLGIDDVSLFVPHQANKRIIDHVADALGLPAERVAMTITHSGNMGCASVAIAMHRHGYALTRRQYAVLVTFGGGYSVGASLFRRRSAGLS
jgi:3-oxoacyl-[acyl-carrier-protein] synthase-3